MNGFLSTSSPRSTYRARARRPKRDEPRGLAAAHADAARAVLSRTGALALVELGVGCRRTLCERLERPSATPSDRLLIALEPARPRSITRARDRRPSRRNRAASLPRNLTPSALSSAAPTPSCPSSAASAYAARRASIPRTLFALASRLHDGACPSSCAL